MGHNTLTPQQQLAIIDRQIAEWQESAYNAEIAHRVHKRIGSEAGMLAQFVGIMTKAETAITELQAVRAELGDG